MASLQGGFLLPDITNDPTETPATGKIFLYLKGTSLKYKDDAGNLYTLATGISAEEVQDIVGAYFTDSSTLDVTYNDAGNVISASVIQTALDHTNFLNRGTNTHAQIDTHLANTSNPHATTASQVGADPTGSAAAAQAFAIQRSNHTGTQLSTTISDFTEAVQDVMGGELTDSATIDFVYNDASNTQTANVIPGGVNHNSLLNGGGTTHIDHATVSVVAGTSLNGGGDTTATRTINHNTFGTAGTYGSASTVPVITTEATGHVTGVVPTAISILSSAVTNFASSVLSTVLTGFAVGANTAIAATDTILQAFGKIQGQINQINADAAVWVELRTTSDVSTSSAITTTALTELQFPIVSGRSYYFEGTILYQTAATTTGIVLTMGSPDGGSAPGAVVVNVQVAADGTAAGFTGTINTLGDNVVSTGVQTANTNYIANMKGTFVANATGNFYPMFRSEVAFSSVTVKAGSVVLVREFA